MANSEEEQIWSQVTVVAPGQADFTVGLRFKAGLR